MKTWRLSLWADRQVTLFVQHEHTLMGASP